MSEHEAARPPQADRAMDAAPRSSWLKTLLLLWGLRRIAAPPRGGAWPALLGLWLSWLLGWICIDWWERQPQPVFAVEGVPLLAWYPLGVLGLALLLRLIAAPRAALGPVLLLATGLVPLPLLWSTVGAEFLQSRRWWTLGAALGLYAVLYLLRGLRMLTGRRQLPAALLGVAFILGFVGLSDFTNAIPDLWNPGDVDPAVSDQRIAQRETALFEQSDRIDAELDAVQRDASSRPQAFFVGFAGVGDEQVFAHEIGLAARVVGERYATHDRQVTLINDERDLDSAPLASVSGLNYALQGLASLMKLDRDVLFLAISSHGTEDPSIAVANSQFPLVDLTPNDLAEALDESGIRWRVIVISACYAGGFVDALRDARTLIITAAAADRTSFGCSNDRDLTYFGEAFYRDALPGAASLRGAFDQARQAIAAREKAEGMTPSDPQAYIGADIEQHLAEIGANDTGDRDPPRQML